MELNVKELASKKVAGVPLLYIAAGVGVVLLYLAIRSKPTNTDAVDTSEPVDTLTGDESLSGDAAMTPLVTNPIFVANPSQAVVSENTNGLWSRQAIQWLISNGATAGDATTAIQKYLSGENLSYSEGQLRDAAVKEFGLPPEDFSSGRTLGYNGPAAKQGEPPTDHIVKGKSDNSFRELAQLYYGLSNADAVNLIAARNASLVEPLATGVTVRIPEWHNPKYYRATSATRTLYAIARVNQTTPAKVQELNPGLTFPVRPSTRVRVK